MSLSKQIAGRIWTDPRVSDRVLDPELAEVFAEKLAEYIEALQWCSAASDFQEGGEAREGWLKTRHLLERQFEIGEYYRNLNTVVKIVDKVEEYDAYVVVDQNETLYVKRSLRGWEQVSEFSSMRLFLYEPKSSLWAARTVEEAKSLRKKLTWADSEINDFKIIDHEAVKWRHGSTKGVGLELPSEPDFMGVTE
jgi:hypothetical protein